MRLRTAMACTAFMVLLFTIAVWSAPLPEEDSRNLDPLKRVANPRPFI